MSKEGRRVLSPDGKGLSAGKSTPTTENNPSNTFTIIQKPGRSIESKLLFSRCKILLKKMLHQVNKSCTQSLKTIQENNYNKLMNKLDDFC